MKAWHNVTLGNRRTLSSYLSQVNGQPSNLFRFLFVAFTFGMVAVEGGLLPWIAVLIAMTSFSGTGQFAGVVHTLDVVCYWLQLAL